MKRVALAFALAACTPQQPSPTRPPAPADAEVPEAAAPVVVVDAGPEAAAPEVVAEPDPSFDAILKVLFAERASVAPIEAACPSSLAAEARIRCLYDERYKGDAKATSLAHEMYVKWRIVAGVEVAHTMDGGYRGMIRLEPEVPINGDRKHLEWVVSAFRDFDPFFVELEKWGRDHGASPTKKPYRFRSLTFRFMRSINVNRPAAYAHDWTVAYNVNSSINLNADMVRETLFHEIFHLNDAAHGVADDYWSAKAFAALYAPILKKCGTSIPCLAPYTPNETIVRGGTYYAFQPGNGVVEYAAELALRYYREQRIALRSLAPIKAFECGPPENARAWTLMKDEFFEGIDATPLCP